MSNFRLLTVMMLQTTQLGRHGSSGLGLTKILQPSGTVKNEHICKSEILKFELNKYMSFPTHFLTLLCIITIFKID